MLVTFSKVVSIFDTTGLATSGLAGELDTTVLVTPHTFEMTGRTLFKETAKKNKLFLTTIASGVGGNCEQKEKTEESRYITL